MVSFKDLILKGDSPIYLQIIMHIKVGIVGDIIQNGDDMPSRRAVSSLLGINPNTIQKAYKQLEFENLIHSKSGAKSLITVTKEQKNMLKKELLEHDILEVISRLQSTGFQKEEALILFEKLWEENLHEQKN
ncbi:MAG: GntR family transcriptional regulator [Clostridia bacterium]